MISIISLNWNTTDMMIGLNETIKKNTVNDYDLIILDNGSKKEEYQKLQDNVSLCTLIREENNLGFAAGNNEACKMVKDSEFVTFINSDILIEEFGWDKKFLQLFEDSSIGIIGCAYHPLKWDLNGSFHIQKTPNEPVESESVQGAFFAIRGTLFKSLLEKDEFILDEEFKYAHYEETDLCFRVRKMNYKVYWVPVKHTHLYNQSATKINGYKLSKEIQNINDFNDNSKRNKQLFVKRHRDFL